MFDTEVEIYRNNQLHNVDLHNYIRNKKVLLCPGIKLTQKPTLTYLKYVDGLLDNYKLDEVIIINSTDDKFFHLLIDSYYPRLTTVTDLSKTYIKNLKESKKKSQSTGHLLKNWRFQHLVDNSAEVGFWEEPLEDHWEHLISNKTAMKKIIGKDQPSRRLFHKMYSNRHISDVWKMEDIHVNLLGNVRKNAEVNEFRKDRGTLARMGSNFWYFTLFRNEYLESCLKQ
jgi:hypothetical protein